jgi:hypothetical protein
MNRALRLATLCAVLALAGCSGGDRLGGGSISACMDPYRGPLRGHPPQPARAARRAHLLSPPRGQRGRFPLGVPRAGAHQGAGRPLLGAAARQRERRLRRRRACAAHLRRRPAGRGQGGTAPIRGQDPNRNFSTSRAESRLCARSARRRRAITGRSWTTIGARPGPYLALHNNGNGHAGNGGSGNISMYRPRQRAHPLAGRRSGSRALRDEDNLIFMAGTRPPTQRTRPRAGASRR